MSAIVNDRDVLLQAALTRFTPPVIPQSQVDGLPGRLGGIEGNVGSLEGRMDDAEDDIDALELTVNSLLNSSRDFSIRASALTFVGGSGATSPATITLTAVKQGGISGTVTWSVFAGSATFSPATGDTTTVTGSTVTGNSVTLRARITMGGVNYDAFVTLTRLGGIAAVDAVNLTSQVTGSLAAGNVSGLGALALLNTVNLNTQTTGALNGLTQVTNLGDLAFANAVAANQIGAGTLAAGVIYAGDINADNITSGTLTGRTVRTADSGSRVEIDGSSNTINFQGPSGSPVTLGPPTSGANNFHLTIPSGRGGMMVLHSGSGSAVHIGNTSGNAGHGLIVQTSPTSPTYAPLRLTELSSLPTNRANGSICYYGGWLCFANGSHWFQSDGTQLT